MSTDGPRTSRLPGFHARTVAERRGYLASLGVSLVDLDDGLSLDDAAQRYVTSPP